MDEMNCSSEWSWEQDKAFESALVTHPEDAPDRWEKIAADVPGKTIEEIKQHYELLVEDVNQIESGCVPLPSYNSSPEGSASHASDEGAGKKSGHHNSDSNHGTKADQERRKGIAWTEDEHRQDLPLFLSDHEVTGSNPDPTKWESRALGRPFYVFVLYFCSSKECSSWACGCPPSLDWSLRDFQTSHSGQRQFHMLKLFHFILKYWLNRLFLLGLEKYGKGDWRSISRNFVVTRTPTQVASHAQKYFIRLNSMNKDRRRSSIHDITNVNNNGDVSASQAPITGQTNGSAGNSTGKSGKQAPPASTGVPSVGIYAAPTIGQPVGGPLVSAVGTPVNLSAPGHMAYGVRAPVPGAPMNIVPITYPMSQTSAPHR
ncbi:hypothetical protein Lal_00025583 [Lupinus albus]|nr:hypothetical protein Lal_00025583 [Lupinus albus]